MAKTSRHAALWKLIISLLFVRVKIIMKESNAKMHTHSNGETQRDTDAHSEKERLIMPLMSNCVNNVLHIFCAQHMYALPFAR